jgi:hypothetical protein
MQQPPHDLDALRRLLKQREDEGLTFKQLSEESGIAIHVLHHRARKDARDALGKPAKAGSFVEITTKPDPRPSGIELQLSNGVRVQLATDFDEGTLARLLATVSC